MVNELLTPAQARAARAWLNWSQEELSAKSGVSQRSIARFEQEKSLAYPDTLMRLREAFEVAGVSFLFEGMSAAGIRADGSSGFGRSRTRLRASE
jgi:transcriptional regulator with XRE-family HTH domain